MTVVNLGGSFQFLVFGRSNEINGAFVSYQSCSLIFAIVRLLIIASKLHASNIVFQFPRPFEMITSSTRTGHNISIVLKIQLSETDA